MISHTLRKQVMERAGNRCEVCLSRGDWRGLQIHHIKHKGMGGSRNLDVLENLILLCAPCHSHAHNIREVKDEATA